MSRPYTSVLDHSSPLPLTDRSARYLRDTVQGIETEIQRMVDAEHTYQQEAASCAAIRDLLTATRDQYIRDLGDLAEPVVQQVRWQVDPKANVREVEEPCPPCGEPMLWTEAYGYVHEVDGWWVVAGQWCAQSLPKDATTVLPVVETEPAS